MKGCSRMPRLESKSCRGSIRARGISALRGPDGYRAGTSRTVGVRGIVVKVDLALAKPGPVGPAESGLEDSEILVHTPAALV